MSIRQYNPLTDDNLELDPCNLYITMQHSAGCMIFDWSPVLKLIGITMIAGGVALRVLVPFDRQIHTFVDVLVRLVAIFVTAVY